MSSGTVQYNQLPAGNALAGNDLVTYWDTSLGATAQAPLATFSAYVSANLGVATATSINGVFITLPGVPGATLTLANNSTLTTIGGYTETFTFTGNTSVTFPTSGTLFSTAGIIPPANGGTGVNNGAYTITIGGNVSTVGTFTSGGTFSTGSTFSTGDSFSTTGAFSTGGAFSTVGTFSTGGSFASQAAVTFSGAFGLTIGISAVTSVTLPTSGLLANTAQLHAMTLGM